MRSAERTSATRSTALDALLGDAPTGWITCPSDRTMGISSGGGIQHLLGHVPGTVDALAARFRDTLYLQNRIDELRAHGVPFDCRLETVDGVWLDLRGRCEAAQDLVVIMLTRASAAPWRAALPDAGGSGTAASAEALHHGLLDALPWPVWLRAADLSLMWCNAAYARAVATGSPLQAVHEGLELARGAIEQDGRGMAERSRRLGAPQSESHPIIVGGERRLLEINEQPFGAGIIGWSEDFTAMEAVQENLGRLIETHAEVLQQLGSGVAMFDSQRRLFFHNRAFAEMWRLPPDWLAGNPDLGEILEHLRDRRMLPEVTDFRAWKREILDRFTQVIASDEEYLFLPNERTVRSVTAPHPLGGLMFLYEDVTDRLALERSYNTLIAVQRETLKELHVGIAVFGSDGRLKLHNPAFAGMWQFEADSLRDEPHVTDLMATATALTDHGLPPARIRSDIIEPILARQPLDGRRIRTHTRVYTVSTTPLADGSILISVYDVTDSYNVERALVERNNALEEADKLKSQFIANVSYELRTPLNTIIGFAEILTNGYFGTLNDRQHEYTDGILEASQRLLHLINDILDLASVEAGQIELDVTEIDVHEMLESVLNLVKERARKNDLQLGLDCAPDCGTIPGDERRLKQVIFNLLSNAIAFTPADGLITLSASRAGGHLFVAVRDTGEGIPSDLQDQAFLAFSNASRDEGRHSGAGLGLTLVKRFIELHGGRVRLESEPGKGTTVTVDLPLTRAPALPPPTIEAGSAAEHIGHARQPLQ